MKLLWCNTKGSKANLLLTLCWFVSLHVDAQKEANHWIFGANFHLDFNQQPVSLSQDVNIVKDTGQSLYGSTTCISDKDGNLLFYSDGETVWNKKHEIMENGTQLKGNKDIYLKNNSIIVPIEDLPGIYYLFTLAYLLETPFGGNKLDSTIYYHIIDMNTNVGLGKVVSKSNRLTDFECKIITAVKHANGRDTWLISRKNDSYQMVAWLVTPCGIGKPIFSKTKGYPMLFESNPYDLVFSPNGKIATMTQHESETFESPIFCYFYTFNDTTGVFKDKNLVLKPSGKSSVFSNNTRFFYEGWGILVQYDLEAGSDEAILNSKVELWHPEVNVPLGTGVNYLGLTPDGRIFINPAIASNSTSSIYVLQHPNQKGIKAQLDSTYIKLPTPKRYNAPPYGFINPHYSFPSFISSFFRPDYKTPEPYKFQLEIISTNTICYKDSLSAEIKNDVHPDSVHWECRNVANQIVWQGKGDKIKLPKMPSGNYILLATAYWRCLNNQIVKTILIEEEPVATINNKASDTVWHCNSTPVLLSGNEGNYTYAWNTTETKKDIYPSVDGQYMLYTTNTCGFTYAKAQLEQNTWNIPNVFTPNADGVNDTWNITSKTTEQAHVKVLNRWGSVVYESEKYANDWDANNVPDGIYFYQITQNEGCQYKGWVQVIR